jgi:hypothetical protein
MIPPATCNRAAPVVIYHQCEANLQVFSITCSYYPIHLYIEKITTKAQTYVCRLARCLYIDSELPDLFNINQFFNTILYASVYKN